MSESWSEGARKKERESVCALIAGARGHETVWEINKSEELECVYLSTYLPSVLSLCVKLTVDDQTTKVIGEKRERDTKWGR